MSITELALLSISDPTVAPSNLRPDLLKLKETLQHGSGHSFTFYSGKIRAIQDSIADTHLLILGSWSSASAHASFISSDENKELLALVDGKLGIDFMVHLDVDVAQGPTSEHGVQLDRPKWVKVVKHTPSTKGGSGMQLSGQRDHYAVKGGVVEGSMGEDVLDKVFEIVWAPNKEVLGVANKPGVVGVFQEIDLDLSRE